MQSPPSMQSQIHARRREDFKPAPHMPSARSSHSSGSRELCPSNSSAHHMGNLPSPSPASALSKEHSTREEGGVVPVGHGECGMGREDARCTNLLAGLTHEK